MQKQTFTVNFPVKRYRVSPRLEILCRALLTFFSVDNIELSKSQALRVFNVLEIRLSGIYAGSSRDSLVGTGRGKYSLADIGAWPWVKGWKFSGFSEEEMGKFPHLLAWIERISQRPAVKRGIGEKYVMPEAVLPDF